MGDPCRGWKWRALVAVVWLSLGCSRHGDDATARATVVDATAPRAQAGAPVWSRDVGPLVDTRCGACHGGLATPALIPPFLGSYEALRRNADATLQAMRRRMMPPFGIDNSGLCGDWADAAWLTAAEIETIGAWVEAGMPAGDDALAVASTTRAPPALGQPLRLDPSVAFAPGLGARASRCFVVKAGTASAAPLVGVTVTAEPAGAVRQANLYALTADAARRARRLDRASGEAGWTCSAAAHIDGAQIVASWSRNSPHQRLPEGTGVPLAWTNAFVVQFHYDLVASPPGVAVRAHLDLTTADVAHAARYVPLQPPSGSLPPRQARTQIRATLTVREPLRLWGLIPGMNTLGRVLDLELTRSQQRTCVAHFGHWDRYDEQLFRRIAPVALVPGDVLTLTCDFSTTSRTEPTKMGEAPDDERCLAQLYVTD